MSSCLTPKNKIPEGEHFLYKQKIRGNKDISYYDLEYLLRQKTNRKILETPLMPYLFIYNLHGEKDYSEKAEKRRNKAKLKFEKKLSRKPGDSLKLAEKYNEKLEKIQDYENEGPFLKREVGEKPVIFDKNLAEETRSQMSLYYKKNGYFENEVKLRIDTLRKNTIVNTNYLIEEGRPTKVRSIKYYSEDSTINSFLNPFLPDYSTRLKQGMIYSEEEINDEIDKLEIYLKNHGYFAFRKQFIFVLVNDTFSDYEVDLHFEIVKTPDPNAFKRYRISKVNFISQSNLNSSGRLRDTIIYDQLHFLQYEDKVKKKLLARKIKIRPNTYYNYDYTIKSRRNLSNLNMYKFANIRYDSTENGFEANIFTSPLQKYSTSVETGVAVTQWLPGPFGNLNFRNRNVFNGAEILDINIQGALEAQTSFSQENEIYQSLEIGSNASLTFPSLAFPTRLRFKFTDLNPKTRLNLGASYVRRPEYSRTNFNTNLRYSISPSNNSLINVQLIDNSLLNTQILDPAFRDYLDDLFERGNNLKFSFGQSINTSFNLEYVYNDFNINKDRQSKYFNVYLESGGTVWNLLNGSSLERNDTVFGLQYFRYTKGFIDLRKYFPGKGDRTLAFKFKTGLAYPYGLTKVMPYEKYFFIGGNNSIRAWRPRRLGPGSYALFNSDGSVNYNFEQPGEILLETNLEYRFNLISFLEGALFIDAGNVWRLEETQTLPGGEFAFDRFFTEIAIGAGYGIRFDFSFLILRLDAGFQVYDPAQPLAKRFVLDNIGDIDPLNPEKTIWNIGIGYPF